MPEGLGFRSNMVAKEDPVPSDSQTLVPSTVSHGVGTDIERNTWPADTKPSSTATTKSTATAPTSTPSTAVIDLTSENPEADLQKAIAASLQETRSSSSSGTTGILGGQVSREEQDISRALEQSLEENKVGTKRKRADLWFIDPLNPHERARQKDGSVGLKNVGNTCWFSAVIQSLFNIPLFRQLVLNFNCPQETGKSDQKDGRNLQFMQELRWLFSLMVGSERRYVDPSRAVEILKEAFSAGPGAATDSQQDVSEFQHKLLDWLEDAFKSDDNSTASGSSSSETSSHPSNNPMVQLFYGEYLAQGFNEGKSFQNKDRFGQFPLQVGGFNDIHESLEGATAQGQIETVNRDVTSESGQELWFTRLPPVLTFELSRFQFNQALGRPEKIHNRLEFPHLIHMDRYLECNQRTTRQKREEVKKLKVELSHLQMRLDRFTKYGSGPKRFPLQDVLRYTLEFAQSGSSSAGDRGETSDVEMDSPKSQNSVKMDSPEGTPTKQRSPSCTFSSDVQMSSPGTGKSPLPHSASCPSPRSVSNSELSVLQTCLQRWRHEVEQDVKELQDSIGQLEDSIGRMYTGTNLQQNPYRLHAVLVHEGQAASGHYWAYVYSTEHKNWLKFNDISVTESSWEELQREGVGGYHNASAYCLMYVDQTRHDVFDVPGCGTVKMLPPDLQEYVQRDNDLFRKEIEDWDTEQQRKRTQTDLDRMTSESQSTSKPGPSGEGRRIQDFPLLRQHAEVVRTDMQKLLEKAVASEADTGARDALIAVYEGETRRLRSLARRVREGLPWRDARLQHMGIYLLANGAPAETHVQHLLLEQFVCVVYCSMDHRKKEIKDIAQFELEELKKRETEEDCKAYQNWHEEYNKFRRVSECFIKGVDCYHKENYIEALPYVCTACDMNEALKGDDEALKGLDANMLQYYRRQCIMQVNEYAVSQFEEGEEGCEDALQLMTQVVLPVLAPLTTSEHPADQRVMEQLRDKWCMFLDQNLTGSKSERLPELLAWLFDPPAELQSSPIKSNLPPSVFGEKLAQKYEETMAEVERSGELVDLEGKD